MSLISQNVPPQDRAEKIKRKIRDDPIVMEGNKDKEDNIALNPVATRIKKKRNKRKNDPQTLEIEQKESKKLENFLFGSLYPPLEFGANDEVKNVVDDGSALFFTDRSGNSKLSAYKEENEIEESGYEEEDKQRKPAWIDEEEESTRINIAKVNRLRKLRKEEDESLISGSDYVSRLRAHHVKLNPGTDWAQLDSRSRGYNSSDDDESDKDVETIDGILRTNEDLVVKSSVKLSPENLEISRLVDANVDDPSSGPIYSVQFHRNGQLLLTAGLDRRVRFFQIDGRRNTKIQSIFLDDCPIRKASFLPDGSQVIISGRRKFFYSFDLVKAECDKVGPLVGRDEKSLENFEVSPDSSTIAFVGNEGYILLVSTKTKELIGTLKMNGTARSLAFADDGRQLLSYGGDGHVYHWDLRTRACFHKGIDEGCVKGTSLCTSPNGALFAAGSDAGIVNIYNTEEFLGGKRQPIKTIENLQNRVSFSKFNHDAQILAIGSRSDKSGLKLIHIPSFNVFGGNWARKTRAMVNPHCLDFSPGGGFMAVGDAAGQVLLYKLHHYSHA